MNRFFLVFLLQFSILVFADDTTSTAYLNGQELCQNTIENRKNEIGFFVTVPIDYNHLDSDSINTNESTAIYTWTLKPFQPELPSVIYFVGGPGQSAHNIQIELPSWNVIYFDQRGIACSRFASDALSSQGRFYSSEFIAKDADLIRQKWGLKKWSVYGHSYGTIPATIYAHLFPENTTALVLEGVVQNGEPELWNSPRRYKILQRFYKNLPDDSKELIRKISAIPGSEFLFSQVVYSYMYLDNSIELIKNYISDLKLVYEKDNAQDSAVKLGVDAESLDLLKFSSNNYEAITCRELSAMNINSNFFYRFTGDGFAFNQSAEELKKRTELCHNHEIFEDSPLVHTYNSFDYPVYVATTYFQGTTDGATTAGQAVQHYKNVAKAQKQILIKINGGHIPNLGLFIKHLDEAPTAEQIDSNAIELKNLQMKIFSAALGGQIVSKENISEINSKSALKWVSTFNAK